MTIPGKIPHSALMSIHFKQFFHLKKLQGRINDAKLSGNGKKLATAVGSVKQPRRAGHFERCPLSRAGAA